MATTRTPNASLQKPGTTDRNWDVGLNANTDVLDAMATLVALLVTPKEFPSSSLTVKVAAGSFINQAGVYQTFAGSASFALPASATTLLWLSDTGTLTSGAAWPAPAHVRLAAVVTGPSSIVSITDQRAALRSATS